MTVYEIDYSLVTDTPPGERYRLPDNRGQWAEELPVTLFDAGGALTPQKLAEIRARYEEAKALHITNTGLTAGNPHDLSAEILDALGFGEKDQFQWGGMTSGRTNLKYISKAMRDTDDYPADKFLLPHNEILYQRFMPERLLFYCAKATLRGEGGRTFVHCAKKAEAYIAQCGPEGRALLDKMRKGGFTIVTGFLDDNHPAKAFNYFRSWQDRFDTTCKDTALSRCLASHHQFDEAYWMDEKDSPDAPTLMTSVTIPAFKKDVRDGETYMFFPRIALDGPRPHNGYRRFLVGPDRQELTDAETAILLQSFMATREGTYYAPGDILLVDNIRYGHSRESFTGSRKIYAAMSGQFWTDDAQNGD